MEGALWFFYKTSALMEGALWSPQHAARFITTRVCSVNALPVRASSHERFISESYPGIGRLYPDSESGDGDRGRHFSVGRNLVSVGGREQIFREHS